MSNGSPKPEAQPLFHEEIATEMRVQPELEATLLRFWDMVRKSADVIVTLRQENVSLLAKLQQAKTEAAEQPTAELQGLRDALTESEASVHSLREELAMVPALRVQVEEMQSLNLAMSQEISRLEKLEVLLEEQRQNEQTLIDRLANAQAELEEMRRTIDRIEDQEEVTSDELLVTSEAASKAEVEELTSQLVQMRVELESRTVALQELRVVMLTESLERQAQSEAQSQPQAHVQSDLSADVEQVILEREALRARVDELDVVAQRYAEAQERIVELEESHSELRAELERTMAVVHKYRAAGVAYLEDPSMEGQVPLFGMEARGKAVTPYMTEEEAKALADRIDLVAQKLAELL